MTSLRDDVLSETAAKRRPCPICAIRDTMTPSERAELDDVIGDDALTGAAIARALQRRGYSIHPDGKQVRAHRSRCAS